MQQTLVRSFTQLALRAKRNCRRTFRGKGGPRGKVPVSSGQFPLRPLNSRRKTSLMLLAFWTVTIIFAVVPIGRYRDRPTWQQVAWIPFVSWPVTPNDAVRNVLLYVPFGYFQALAGGYQAPWRAVAHAAVLATATEATQIYSRGRYPSTTDVVCNTIGATIGFAWARRRASRTS